MGQNDGGAGASPGLARRAWDLWWWLVSNWVAFSALIVAAVAMAEIDRMIEQCVTAFGESYSMSTATGILPASGAWYGWATSPIPPDRLIMWHAAWDVVFAASYALLGFRLYRSLQLRRMAWAWVVLFAVELTESGAEIVLAVQLASEPASALVSAAWWIGLAKWVVLGILVLYPLLSARRRGALVAHVRRWFAAFAPHAPQLIGVTAVGVFALVPRGNLFDQYPDLVRSIVTSNQTLWLTELDWVRDRGWSSQFAWSDGLGWPMTVDLIAGFVYFALLAWLFGVFAVEARTRRVRVGSPGYAYWLIIPTLALVSALVLIAVGRAANADAPRAWIFIGVAALPVVASAVWITIDHGRSWHGFTRAGSWFVPDAFEPSPELTRPDADGLKRMRRASHLVTGLVLLVFGAGLVRAFAAPIALRYAGGDTSAEALAPRGTDWAMLLLSVGVIVAVVVPRLAGLIWRWADPSAPALDTGDQIRTGPAFGATLWRVVAIVIAGSVLLWWVFSPLWLADRLGPVVTIVIVVLLVVVIVWALQEDLREREPLRVFAWMGFRSDPVLLLTVVVPLLLLVIPEDPAVHPIHAAGAATDGRQRLTVEQALTQWYDDSSCSVPVSRSPGAERDSAAVAYVRPMLLVAAEGGGIRAAAWTSRVIDELVVAGDCGASVFLSSGVSGGAVGLTLSGLADRAGTGPDEHPGFDLSKRLAHSRPLAVSVSGLLVGDMIAGVTGIRIPTDDYEKKGTGLEWQDRAANLQHAWADRVDALRGGYTFDRRDPVGWMILNSSAVGYGCRVVISQVDLQLATRTVVDPGNGARLPSCAGGTPGVANAIDLHEVYGPCTLRLDWATASLLSARFPIVSPAGHTGVSDASTCDGTSDIQLTDGGVVDNSGLATVADLIPSAMASVRALNAGIPQSSPDRPWVVPIVVYISNTAGGDVPASVESAWTDAAIAKDGQGQGNEAQNSDRVWLQRIAAHTADPCADPVCAATAAVVRASVGHGVAVVAPRSGPTVAAPLGWALSDVSLVEIGKEVEELVAHPQPWATCYGELGHVLRALTAVNVAGSHEIPRMRGCAASPPSSPGLN